MEGASEDQLAAIAAAMWTERAGPGQVLGREGERGDQFWLIVSGSVSITVAEQPGGRLLATAGPGAIVGELAVLRGRPRTATVTAREESLYLAGGRDAMERVLAAPPVRRRLQLIASRRLAQDLQPIPFRLRDGTALSLRPLLPTDRDAIDAALHNLSPSTIRRRFFTESIPSPHLVEYLVDVDYVDHFAWIALDEVAGEGVAVARYVRGPGGTTAEMAFTTVDRMQGRGVGTFLLGAVGATAGEAGVERLEAFVMADNAAMRAVFAKAGGITRYDEPGVVKVMVEPGAAARLLDDGLRTAIAGAVHDVVTAASLALI